MTTDTRTKQPPAQPGRTQPRRWWRAEAGAAAAEVTLVLPFLIMLLLFTAVVVHRGVTARLRLDDAAHQAARAASIERSGPAAQAAARSAAEATVTASGVACVAVRVDVDTGELIPGATVRTRVACQVDLGDALMLGVPGTRELSATASEVVDTWRAARSSSAKARR
ncbi:TadE/TadG family type IV pilus assembly protein [Actinoalloteichus caeruleus]|uniref:TadE/TadG family type IV pilus assembly protein n=1 Tax=Actinoalloteichus cyanogriseus TaxID=2893586 RepID=UPI003AAEBBC2